MKLLLSFFKEKRKYYLFVLMVFIIFMSISFLYSVPLSASLYALLLSVLLMAIFLIFDYIRYLRKHKELKRYLELNQVYSIDEIQAEGLIEDDYVELINKVINEKREMETFNIQSANELKDYYAIWAHQIKTPIAAIDLMLQVMQNNKDEINVSDIKQEMFKIDFYVDAVMNYLRLEDMSSDFKFVKVSAEKIVKCAVKKFSTQFINKHISIELEDLDKEIYSDEKWLGFIIEQLISNAIKYTESGGKVRIYFKETFNINDRVLVVEDNGIGISKEDIPRIMERGYTGYNGRMNKKSSGIGLYLCSKAAKKLGCDISFDSEPGKGTKVNIDLTREHTLHE